MTVVVDANIIASLALPLSYSDTAAQLMSRWNEREEQLIAPVLFEYEIATILRRAVSSGQLPPTRLTSILTRLLDSRVNRIAPSMALHQDALHLAERVGQAKAYDAHYLALAQQESAVFWTVNRRLANGARQAGLARVQWIGDWQP